MTPQEEKSPRRYGATEGKEVAARRTSVDQDGANSRDHGRSVLCGRGKGGGKDMVDLGGRD